MTVRFLSLSTLSQFVFVYGGGVAPGISPPGSNVSYSDQSDVCQKISSLQYRVMEDSK